MADAASYTMSTTLDALTQDQWKKEAAEAAAALVNSGMVVGLGTGSTAKYAIEALGRRVAEEGLKIVGIATSERSNAQARDLNIPMTSFAEQSRIDLTIDGADEVLPGKLTLIKGHGGALLREKIVASASKRMAVVADESKIVEKLGQLVSVPTEVVPFGWQITAKRLARLGGKPRLRLAPNGEPYVTDGGHYILDCAFGKMNDPAEIAHELDCTVGVVEHGIFLGLATEVFVGGPGGVALLKRSSSASATRGKSAKSRTKTKSRRR
jgi:ribose 5-phosphate isomerase A